MQLDQVKIQLYLMLTGHLDGIHIHIVAGIALIIHKIPIRPGSLPAASQQQNDQVHRHKQPYSSAKFANFFAFEKIYQKQTSFPG